MKVILGFLMDYITPALKVALCVVLALGGYKFAQYKYEAQIADLVAQNAKILSQERETNAKKLSEAFSQVRISGDKLNSLTALNRDLLSRLQRAERIRRSTESATSERALRAEISSCRKLLQRGAELSQRGCELLGACARDADALITLVK